MGKNKQSLKTTDSNTLRGTGFNSMGWTEGGKQVKNAKRMMATFDDIPSTGSYKTHRKEVQCTKCGKTFKTNNDKLPKHRLADWRWAGWCRRNDDGTVSSPKDCDGEVAINEVLENIMIDDVQYKTGDKVLYTVQERDISSLIPKLKMVTYEDTIKTIRFGHYKDRMGYFSRLSPTPGFTLVFKKAGKIRFAKIVDILKIEDE